MSLTPAEQAVERLRAWLNDLQLSARIGFPTYANPGELKADLGVLLAALDEAQQERDEWKRRCGVVMRERELARRQADTLAVAAEEYFGQSLPYKGDPDAYIAQENLRKALAGYRGQTG